jgi:LPXTG-motif cell wall-anchored protein
MTGRRTTVLTMLAVVGLLGAAGPARAHGGGGMEAEAMAMQPARTLAQQGLAELRVRNDVKEAAERLDAALESKDKSGIDVAVLRNAMEMVDKGDPKAAIPMLDEALSRPLGASSGKALHEAGREFQPATGAQEIVGIAAGAVLLALGALLLWRARRRPRAARPAPAKSGN